MRSAPSSRIDRRQLALLAREMLRFRLHDFYGSLVSALGELISLAIVSAALSSAWGLQLAASYVTAIIVTGATSSALSPLQYYGWGGEVAKEASLPRRVINRLSVLVNTAVALCANPLITTALLLLAVSLGYLPPASLNIVGIITIALAPTFSYQGVTWLLSEGFNRLVWRLRIFGSSPPLTWRDYAWLLLQRLWISVVERLVFTLTPVFFPLWSLPAPVNVLAAIVNPYALSIELSRHLVLGMGVPLELAAATLAVSLFWFALKLYFA